MFNQEARTFAVIDGSKKPFQTGMKNAAAAAAVWAVLTQEITTIGQITRFTYVVSGMILEFVPSSSTVVKAKTLFVRA